MDSRAKAARLKHYRANKEVYRANADARRQTAQAFVRDSKLAPCADCHGVFPPVCMDFDHVGGDKTANVSKMARDGASIAKLVAEISKCDLVCANCHRIRTAARGAWQGCSESN